MKYLCLGYYDEGKFDALTPDEVRALASQCRPFDDELQGTGRVEMVASLGPSRSWISLRPHDGGTRVVDGPYAEAKEIIGSFFLIEADDRQQAIEIASKPLPRGWASRSAGASSCGRSNSAARRSSPWTEEGPEIFSQK